MGAMAMGGAEEDFRWQMAGSGISRVAVEETVVGAATTRCTTAPMKREDAMKGSWSSTVDERSPSLAVDDGVGVAAPARWRMGGGRRRLAAVGRLLWRRWCMNGEMEGEGDLKLWDALV